jgi:hypothetical protein
MEPALTVSTQGSRLAPSELSTEEPPDAQPAFIRAGTDTTFRFVDAKDNFFSYCQATMLAWNGAAQPLPGATTSWLSMPRRLYGKRCSFERLLSTDSSRIAASKGFLIRHRAPTESAWSSK